MTHRIKHTVRSAFFTLSVILIPLLILGCQQNDDGSFEDTQTQQSRYQVEMLDHDDILYREPVMKHLKGFAKEKTALEGEQCREIYNSDYGFTIDTDRIKHLVDTETGMDSYNFPIVRDSIASGNLENLLLQSNQEGGYGAYIVDYGFTEAEYLNASESFLEETTTSYMPIDFDLGVFNAGELARTAYVCVESWEQVWVPANEGDLVGEFEPGHYEWMMTSYNCSWVYEFTQSGIGDTGGIGGGSSGTSSGTSNGSSGSINVGSPPTSEPIDGIGSTSPPTTTDPSTGGATGVEDTAPSNEIIDIIGSPAVLYTKPFLKFVETLGPDLQSFIDNPNNIAIKNQLQTFLEENGYSDDVKAFTNELVSIIKDDVDDDAIGFVLEAYNQDKVFHNFDADFFFSVDQYTNIDLMDIENHDPVLLHYLTKVSVLKSLNPEWSYVKVLYEATKDVVHIALDVFGMIPVVGEIADLANGALYLLEGDGVNATLSLAAAIPLAGNSATISKYTLKIINAVSDINSKVKLVWKIGADGIEFGSSSQLRAVLGVTSSNFQAHHIIPWAKRTHPAVQKAVHADGAFHMNEALNGIPLNTSIHYGSHPNYSNLIQQRLDNINLNQSTNQVYDDILDIINDVRNAIQNNPTTPINQLVF